MKSRAMKGNWERLSPPGHKLVARWRHPSGWEVWHCGHPTALWPYAATAPDRPECVVASHTGRGWRTLKLAFTAIEEAIAGGLELYEDGPCKHGHRLVLADPDDPPAWVVEQLLRNGDARAFAMEAA